MWNAVAPALAERFTVIAPDLRGYGGSFKPEATQDHAPYSKREMAKDLVAVMEHFGHGRFKVGSHDRGARVAHRLALDHPERVEKLAVLDIVPTIEHFERANMEFAMGYYHWFWFAQPHPIPELVISAAPDAWFHGHTSRSPKPTNVFHPDALADYLHYARQPDTTAACARTIAPRRPSISCTTAKAAPPGRRCNARCWCCGAATARSANGTSRCRYGRAIAPTR